MPNEGFYEDTAHGRLEPERIIYANVRACPGERVNGVLYFIDPAELAAIDEREWTYNRIVVPWTSDEFEDAAGEAYMYVAKSEWILTPGRPRSWAAIRQTYVETIKQGVAFLGSAFNVEYVKTTDPIPEELILYDKAAGGAVQI